MKEKEAFCGYWITWPDSDIGCVAFVECPLDVLHKRDVK